MKRPCFSALCTYRVAVRRGVWHNSWMVKDCSHIMIYLCGTLKTSECATGFVICVCLIERVSRKWICQQNMILWLS